MIKRLFFLKPIIAALLLTANCITYAAVPDSIRKNLEDFDYLTSFTEENHAVFPAIMEQGYKKTYESLKKKLRKQVAKGLGRSGGCGDRVRTSLNDKSS